MKKIKFTHVKLENFCGIKEFETDLSNKVFIKGKNATGKSTIRNAITWLLFDKLADGSSANGIRPHDSNGNDIDFIDISVSLTVNDGDRDIVLTKTQKQDWTVLNGTDEKKFKGNKNTYAINDIPKSQKDFSSYLEEHLADADTLMFCMNPFSFLALDTKKRRKKLFELVSGFKDEDVIKKNKEFSVLKKQLQDGTVDDLIVRNKQNIKKLKERLSELPTRIDEVSKSIIDIDLAEVELEKNMLQEQLDECVSKQESILKSSNEVQEIQAKILEKKFELSGIVTELNKNLVSKKRDIEDKIFDLERNKKIVDSEVATLKIDISRTKDEIKRLENEIKDTKKEYLAQRKVEFDESSLICPNCKQEYPADKKDEIKAKFEADKSELLESIAAKGIELRGNCDKCNEDLEVFQNKLSLLSTKSIDKEINKLNSELLKLPKEADVSKSKEYKNIVSEIDCLEKREKSLGNLDVFDLKRKEADLRNNLADIEKKLNVVEINNNADLRIDELRKEQKSVSQKIADEEKNLYLLEKFNKEKIDMITDQVNSYFNVISWKLFQKQINGGLQDVCIPLVNGSSVDGLLNHGDKLLAQADLCKAFQKANKIKAPIFIDDTESIDTDRIPKIDSQLILLRRTDDKNLTVESE